MLGRTLFHPNDGLVLHVASSTEHGLLCLFNAYDGLVLQCFCSVLDATYDGLVFVVQCRKPHMRLVGAESGRVM